jgi:hypothetical protein
MALIPIRNICLTKHEKGYLVNNIKTVLIISMTMIAFFMGIDFRPSHAKTVVASGQIYVVKKGDTLRQIAKDYLGSAEKYKELAELNELEIETIDGIDYVWLEIGQVIKLSLTEDDALRKSWELIVKRIKKISRIDLKAAPKYLAGFRIIIATRDQIEISGQNIHLTLANLSHIKKVLEWYSLLEFAIATTNAAYRCAETPEQIIEYTKVLLALAEQESSYRNIPGRHGEYGWWQMKPSTAVLLDDSVDLPTAEWLLQSDPTWTATLVLRHLMWGKKKYGSWEGAFTFYNGGSNNRYLEESYAEQVMKRLEKFSQRDDHNNFVNRR